MSYPSYSPETDLPVSGAGQSGPGVAGCGRTGAGSGSGGVDTAVAGNTGKALGQVLAGMAGNTGLREFHAGIEAGQRMLGNRAFMHWVEDLQPGGREAVAPLQLMGKKKKKPVAVEDEAGSGEQAAGAEGEAGVVAEGTAAPGPEAARPQASGTVPGVEPETVEGAAGGAKKKKKKSRVQVALNTLRDEGVAAFGSYIEAEIGEAELLRTLVERITRAEDLGSVRKAALEMVEARLRLLDPAGGCREAGAVAQPQGREPEMAVIAPVKSEFNIREMELFDACARNQIGRFKNLLGHRNVEVNISDRFGTFLCHAAHRGFTGIVEVLLSRRDIDVNLGGLEGATPLYLAAQQGYVKIVQLLLEKKSIKFNLASLSLVTPLMVAIHFGHDEVVKLLLAAPGIDIGMRKNDGGTALFMAAQENYPGIVEQLVRRGADINQALPGGTTPLYMAIHRGHLEVGRILLQAPGIRVNLATSQGSVPLMIAAHGGHKDITRQLIRNGADPNKINDTGLTALHIACLMGDMAIVQMLLNAGADPDVEMTDPDVGGQTPYDLAELGGHRGVMSVLSAHRRRRAAGPPRPEQLPITTTPGGEAGTPQAVSGTEVEGETVKAKERVSPIPPTPSPPGEAASGIEPPTPLAQAKDSLRQEVLGKLRADNFDWLGGMHLLQDVNATTDMDGLCALYNRLAHIERLKERDRRRSQRFCPRESLPPAEAGGRRRKVLLAAAPVFALGKKTGLDTEAVEGEIKRHLGQKYQRFVSQAVNDMEFGRGKPTTGYPGLWHASAGIPDVGSCSVFYYLDAERNRIRIVGIGHHVGRAAYWLDYATAELGKVGSILHIA